MVATTSGGIGFLLLCTLGYAAGHPGASAASLVRLLWCSVPLAAVVQLAVAVARADPAGRGRSGLFSAGFGPVRLALLAAASTAVWCAAGSALALPAFLYLRGDLAGVPFDGAASELLGARQPLPFAAVATLLGVTPALAGAAAATALRPRSRHRGAETDPRQAADPTGPAAPARAAAPTGLPWGVALVAAGLALEAYTGHGAAPSPENLLPLPGRNASPPGVIGGWVLTAVGLVLAGPGLTHLTGRLLSIGRPGALRLLAGRVLQEEARRIGPPLGVLCAVASGALAAPQLYGTAFEPAGARPFGALTGLGAALVMACATATVLTTAMEAKNSRSETTSALLRLGAPAVLLRRAAALRATALLAVLAPVTWAVGELAALPLAG
jgi:hypothetical protein